MTTLAYADAFLPTPMASVAMGRAAHLSEATWADEQAVLTHLLRVGFQALREEQCARCCVDSSRTYYEGLIPYIRGSRGG